MEESFSRTGRTLGIKRGKTLRLVKKYRAIYLIILPTLLYLLIFRYLPMFGLVIAFEDYRPWLGFFKSPWVWFKWFDSAMGDKDFWRAAVNTVIIALMKLGFGFPAPILLAILINEINNRAFKRTVQTISYLPYFLSWVILSVFMFNMFSYDMGYLNRLLVERGLPKMDWYRAPGIWRGILTATSVWKSVGWSTIIYLAGIAGIGQELYEAATLDGCGRFKRILYITLPGLMPTIVILLILNSAALVQGDFEQIYAIFGGYNPQAETTEIIETYVYKTGVLQSQYSYGAAVGLFKSVIATTLVLLSNRIAGRMQKESGYRLF